MEIFLKTHNDDNDVGEKNRPHTLLLMTFSCLQNQQKYSEVDSLEQLIRYTRRRRIYRVRVHASAGWGNQA